MDINIAIFHQYRISYRNRKSDIKASLKCKIHYRIGCNDRLLISSKLMAICEKWIRQKPLTKKK